MTGASSVSRPRRLHHHMEANKALHLESAREGSSLCKCNISWSLSDPAIAFTFWAQRGRAQEHQHLEEEKKGREEKH